MRTNLKLVKVDSDYCNYLRKYDNKVAYNYDKKETRPFVGVLFTIDSFEYFAPLSSPKPKHVRMSNTIDFFKIKDGELGAINFNNMIPVTSNNYEVIYFDVMTKVKCFDKYNELLKSQLSWLNANYYQVRVKSYRLYDLYVSNRLPVNIRNRCCNFKLLEEKCNEYNKENVNV